MIIRKIDYKTAVDFLLPKHYSGRIPSISYSYGWFYNNNLMAVITFGKPASNPLCIGVCGVEHSKNVYELNRLCRVEELSEPLSMFVSGCIREIQKEIDMIIISYADTEMNHNGYIYQATNFIYTGATKKRTDKYTEGNKHCRHYSNEEQNGLRKVRSSKHRYIYFATKNKRLKKSWLKDLKYGIEPYPKSTNKNYQLGEFLKPNIIYS